MHRGNEGTHVTVVIPEALIREIRERTDIVEVISSYGVNLKREGADFVALCPFHNEKTASFHVHPNSGYYKCFGCGKSGDVIAFLQENQGMTFMDAITTLAERCGVELKQEEDAQSKHRRRLLEVLAEACAFYRRVLASTKEAQIARDYLSQRKIGANAQADFCIGYAPRQSDIILTWAEKHKFTYQELGDAGIVKMPEGDRTDEKPYHRFAGRLMFAIKDSAGRVVGFSGRQLIANKKSGKYVNSPETAVFKKGFILYGLDKAAPHITKSPHREAILCEGQIDCIRLHTSGFPVALAPQGTAFTAEHASILKRYADSVILVFDADSAGQKATVKAARLLLSVGIPSRVITLPDGDDPDSFLSSTSPQKGPKGFQSLIDNAESIISFQYKALKAHERSPSSVDAIQRMAKSLLETAAFCKNAILKDALLSEIAATLGIPKTALQDEIVKTKIQPIQPARQVEVSQSELLSCPDNSDDSSSSQCTAERYPSPLEFSLITALVCCENDENIKSLLSQYIEKNPSLLSKFSVPFMRNFISAFLSHESMPIGAFAETLSQREREWLDKSLSIICPADTITLDAFAPSEVISSILSEINSLPSISCP